ncbi:putative methyltransferase-like protein [Leptotrombidium deliense]|uniref:Putative methyltransferase-like protein n=1 Tax=Leptotrombidium deliense TaxID=299467 RepID=A0A443S2M0_9ACAR|nr:putative methyltransferase-like protein [Leptotrombidium deliense]
MAHRLFEEEIQAKCYKSARPVPSQQIIHKIIDYLDEKLTPTDEKQWNVAVDVGAGSGQCTEMLQHYFKTLHAFDISEAQVNQARLNNQFENIHYKVSFSKSLK